MATHISPSNDSARRILYVEGNVDTTVGGSYFSLFFLASRLDRSLYEPIVVFAAKNDLIPRFHERGIRTIVRPLLAPVIRAGRLGRISSKLLNFIRGWIIEPFRLARMLRRERIHLVHLNNSIIKNHPWIIAARLAQTPCITHERGINSRFMLRARFLARSLDTIICISSAVHQNFISLGLGHLPMRVIHNGLDVSEMRVTRSVADVRSELRLADDCRLIGIVGNIKSWKGQEVVVRAMAILSEEFPQAVCLLIGDTAPGDLTYRAKLESLIDNLGLAGRVLITGYRKDVANYVNALEIQVHASVDPEPFGRVLLEGMALAKPLIAIGGGAVPEIVVNGKTGLLFKPGDPNALASCLRALLMAPDTAVELGRAGRDRLADNFSIEHNVIEISAIYAHLIR